MKRELLILCVVLGRLRAPAEGVRPHRGHDPMRDGARLHTLIYAPKNGGKLPFLMERSPYGWTGKKPDNVLAAVTRSWPTRDSFSYFRIFADAINPTERS